MAIHSNQSADLRSTLALVKRRKWLVAVVVLVVVGISIAASMRATPLYTSTAQVQVNPLDPNQLLSGYDYSFFSSMENEVIVAESPQVAEGAARVVTARGGDASTDTGALSVESPVNTSTLTFTYVDPSPQNAQLWAGAYAASYIADRQQRAQEASDAAAQRLDSSIDDLRNQLDRKQQALSSAPPDQEASIQNEINSLISQIASLEATKSAVPSPYQGATMLVSPAQLPTSPSSPKPVRNAVLALVLGLGLGFGAALLRERLDDRTVGKADLEQEIGAPVLGVIPKVTGWRKRTTTQLVARDAPKGAASEAYRSVRTNVQFLSQTTGCKVFAITSANLGEGKTTTVANLGVSLAQTGAHVLLISADLRKPRLHRFFGDNNITGLSDVLQGHVGLVTAAQRTGVDSLRLVASGPIPQNPAELLGLPQLARILEELKRAADFILIDTPPALAVSDILPIARVVDAVIIVADANATTRTALRHTHDSLQQVGANIVGGIYNSFDPSKGGSYGNYYGYGYAGYEEKGRDRRADMVIPLEQNEQPENIWGD